MGDYRTTQQEARAMTGDRKQCREIIEGPNGSDVSSRPRPWWRRKCRRLAQPGSDYCWQHASWHRDEEGEPDAR